jgi:hypothetical protein
MEATDASTASITENVRKSSQRSLSSRATSSEGEVLIEGPLQERSLFFFWPERWCVLDEHELRIYRDEEECIMAPDSPIHRHRVDKIDLVLDFYQPSVINCVNVDTHELLTCLRTGPGSRWEEVAATSLWLAIFSRVRGPGLEFLLGSYPC